MLGVFLVITVTFFGLISDDSMDDSISHCSVFMGTQCLQCIDAVGWAAGRASGL